MESREHGLELDTASPLLAQSRIFPTIGTRAWSGVGVYMETFARLVLF